MTAQLPAATFAPPPLTRLIERRISVLAGPERELDGGVLFGATPRNLWGAWYRPDFNNQVRLASRSLLVQQGRSNILVLAGSEGLLAPWADTCACHCHHEELIDALQALGLTERDIDVVLLTHLHAFPGAVLRQALQDETALRLRFPKARYLVGTRQWARATRPHPRDRGLFLQRLLRRLESSERLSLIDSSIPEFLGEGWKLHCSDGYTPGQLLPEIAMPGGPLIYAGDLIPGIPWLRLEVCSALDRDAECTVGEKEQLLDYLVATRGRLILSRDPDVAMAKILRDRSAQFQAYDLQQRVKRLEG